MVNYKCHCLSALSLIVFDSLFVFRIALWPIAGKELTSAFRSCCFTLCRLNCMCSFPVWSLGQDVEFDCIGSSLSFRLLIMSLHVHTHFFQERQDYCEVVV